MNIEQSKLVMIYKSDYNPEMWKHSTLAAYMLGGDVSSKLFTVVREKLSLCYYCSARFARSKSAMTISSGVEKTNIEKAKAAIEEQLNELCNGNFTDDDIAKSKLSLCNSLKASNDFMDSISSWIGNCIYDDKYVTPEEEIEEIQSITREQIIAAANALKLDTVYTLTSSEEDNT